MKGFWDNPEELFIGAMLQFPLYFVVGWWVIPIMIACALLWRAGGTTGGNKILRRLGVPMVVCLATSVATQHWMVMLAVPFMVWLAPSYGKESWLYKLIGSNFLTRTITYAWYWVAFCVFYA